MFPIYAKAAGIDAGKVKWVVAGSDALPAMLATNKVPCVGQFVVGEALLQRQAAPQKLIRFGFANVGLTFYGNGIVATDATFATKPDLVKRFVAATIHGMKDAFANPEEAAEILHKYHREIDTGIGAAETRAVAELAQVKGQPLGMIDQARIKETIDVVNGAFKLKYARRRQRDVCSRLRAELRLSAKQRSRRQTYAPSTRSLRGRMGSERHAVHAVAKAGRPWAVVERVTEMATAAWQAQHGARDARANDRVFRDGGAGKGRPETRPAGAAVELGRR